MSLLIIIPARHASTRFPGKPLAPLRGVDGREKPLIQWSWEAARRAADLARILVATDDARIAAAVESFGGEVAMTSPFARNGTERCAEALDASGLAPELVINLQGDSPLVRRSDILALVETRRSTSEEVLTPYIACDAAMEAALLAEDRAGRVGGTTVVTDQNGRALYFSKRPIPYRSAVEPRLKLHVGLYAYTPDALRRYANGEPTPLEQAEGLEQLRFLEQGIPVRAVEVEPRAGGFWEVNNPEDVKRVETMLGTTG